MKKLATLTVVAGLVAFVATQLLFVAADEPQYIVYRASLEGQSSGPPKFVEDPDGSTVFHWDRSYGTVAEYLNHDPEPQTLYGYLSTVPGRPPICVCPNSDDSCRCVVSPGGGGTKLDLNRR